MTEATLPLSTAFFVNGGAGRVISSIPAFELYAEENPQDDFIIVCEGGMDVFRGHPILHPKSYDSHHKNLFNSMLKNRRCKSLEPYRVWEYYNQKCSIAQAFDIEINNKGIRSLSRPTLKLSTNENNVGFLTIQEIKQNLQKSKTVVFQPFGRSTDLPNGFPSDPSGRSFDVMDAAEIVKRLEKKYAVVLMSEFDVPFQDLGCKNIVARPQTDIRGWCGIIEAADYFLGCDSVGQHIAYSLSKPATVVMGSTFPINTSYPDTPNFRIIDIDKDQRVYSPIRITMDDELDRINDRCLKINKDSKIIDDIVRSIDKVIGSKK